MNTDVGRRLGGAGLRSLPPGLLRRKEAHIQLLCLPCTLWPLYLKLIGVGGEFFFFFPPISLLVQPQKVLITAGCQATLCQQAWMLDSPLIDFALPTLGKHKLAVTGSNSLKGIINHALCPSITPSGVAPTLGGVMQAGTMSDGQGGPRRPEVSLLNLGHSQVGEQPRQVPAHRGHSAHMFCA